MAAGMNPETSSQIMAAWAENIPEAAAHGTQSVGIMRKKQKATPRHKEHRDAVRNRVMAKPNAGDQRRATPFARPLDRLGSASAQLRTRLIQ